MHSSACANETFVCIKLKHKLSYKRDPCVGYIEGDLADDLYGDGMIDYNMILNALGTLSIQSVSLRKGPFEPSPVTATLFLKLENSDAQLNAKMALRNLQPSLTGRN